MRGTNFIAPELKFKRYHKQPVTGLQTNIYATKLHHGFCGLKALQHGFMNPKQLELARRIIVKTVGKRRNTKRARIWQRTFPDRPITGKPLGVRMGRGKGNIKYWVAPVRPGKILFELPKRVKRRRSAIASMLRISNLMPMKTALAFRRKASYISNNKTRKTVARRTRRALNMWLFNRNL